jgi:tyrosinase
MKIELLINNNADPKAAYVTWAPAPCRIRLTETTGLTAPLDVKLRNKAGGAGGVVVFRGKLNDAEASSLDVTLQLNGESVEFFVAGKFGRPSIEDRDVIIEVVSDGAVVAESALMVRIRKNAIRLTTAERDRFVAAFAQLNDKGLGRFVDFREMHTNGGSPEAHGAPGFLPWHRSYLLDLERELQAIDSSVALPYWRFDRAAPALFTPDFLGSSNTLGTVQFSATNPLAFWKTDGVQGVTRRPFFNTNSAPSGLLDEAGTLALGNRYVDFQNLEFDPHGLAHTSFGGSISSIGTAARDPLFFLLHANVDRLWAKWQQQVGRFDAANAQSFDANLPGGNRVGHNLPDTMWPWNGVTTPPRPSTAPGGSLAASPCVSAPGGQPVVRQMLDFQGRVSFASRLGFDYDDVPFA